VVSDPTKQELGNLLVTVPRLPRGNSRGKVGIWHPSIFFQGLSIASN
jgi:hypothetical protein